MQNPVYIITGTTRGLGKHIKDRLLSKDEKVISINRSDVDLSKPEIVATFLQTLRQKIKTEYRDYDVIFINNAAIIKIIDIKTLNITGLNK